uniref:peptidylprolyl isomerase n=1 Tax=Tetradesmus obliquus TaxID=3088 RepID=A0A383W6I9_TETOB|eukprot:jgi/Sobl393_1/11428/SZX72820.1
MAEPVVEPVPQDFEMNDDAEYDFEDKVGVEKDLSGDGGCKKTILRKGEGWESPEVGDEVTVHYVGTLLDGTKFDSSRDRGDYFSFQLGKGKVIKGWDTGVASMKKGELANLVCRADYAYGAAGSPPTIPPDATLQFEVELISWKSVKDITGDGGVIKTIVSEGQGWQNPKDADEVVVTFTARLKPTPTPEDAAAAASKKPQTAAELGLPVVASSPEGGAVFEVGAAPCSGFAAALRSMKHQESALLLLKPEYAAGVAEVPEGQLLEVEFTLSELHRVDTPAPGVTKKILSELEGNYNKPNDGSSVTVVVTTRSVDGATVYEEQREVTFTTDEEQVPEGLELAVHSMRAEEHALVTISDPALAAAPEGAVAGTGVPAGAGAVYDITLKSFVKAKEKWEMNNQEKLASALSRKEKGNAAYKAGRLARAARQYSAAVEAANSIQERDLSRNPAGDADGPSPAALLAQAKDVKKACANNWAAVELKRKNWGEAASQATKVLELDPTNIKALYRRAQARMGLGELLEAELDIRSGLLNEPENADLVALNRKLKVQMRELNKKEAKLYGKMFAALGKGSSSSAEEQQQQQAANGEQAAAADATDAAPMETDAATAPAAAPVVEAAA